MQHPLQRRIWRLPLDRLQLWDVTTALQDPAQPLTIITDASSSGWGATCGTITIQGIWSERQASLSSNWHETWVIIHAIKTWTFVRETRVLALTDNSTAVAVINARRPDAEGLALLAGALNDLERVRNIQVISLHIPGILNDLPDSLSRQKPILAATPLDVTLEPLHHMGIQPTALIGSAHPDAMRFMRLTPMPPPRGKFLIVIATPDIPFLHNHLRRWTQLNTNLQGWILTPALPTRDLPIPGATPIAILPPLIETLNTSWILLSWRSTGIKH